MNPPRKHHPASASGGRSPRVSRNHLPLAAASWLLAASLHAATSVSQHGVTWKWNEDRTTGQYCNGDWWVIGPVTITAITPASATIDETLSSGVKVKRIINGTMTNPWPMNQGWDNATNQNGAANVYAPYNSSLNVAPSITGRALSCPAGTSVVSSISKAGLPKSTSNTQIERLSILTVVASAPAAGSFRPPPVGSDKTSYWKKSQLNYGVLRSLAPVSGTPSLSSLESSFAIPWTALHHTAACQSMSPAQMPNYGRDQAQLVGDAMLSLHLNHTNAQKEKLFIRMVQYGIDIHGTVKAGALFMDNGGLNPGRKAPLVLAAVALNETELKKSANAAQTFKFAEDRQTFVVQQSDVGRVMYTADGRPRETYRQEHVGLPEWGEQHISTPNRDASNWNAFYRHTNAPLFGNVLATALLAGGRATWNWEPCFNYYLGRFWPIEKKGQLLTLPNAINSFAFNMGVAYEPLASGKPGVSPPTGLRIEP